MDYEKAYKEAMEKVRSLHDNANEISKLIDLREELEEIFPEFKESEDERIIRIIMNALTKVPYSELDGLIPDTIRIWIERKLKQGEQKPVKVPKFKVGDFIQFNGMGHTRYTVKEVCGLSHYINTCNKRMDMSYTDANFELVEQKPAEWSEEDEAFYQRLEQIVCKVDIEAFQGDRDLHSWLKPLRPQSQWKPSGEQMKVLNEVLNFAANHESPHWNDYIFGTLNNLIRQLKKLREE